VIIDEVAECMNDRQMNEINENNHFLNNILLLLIKSDDD
jgi:hypothetical protein